ncbi:MAG: hypothetical protein ACOCUS_06025 [Polyangiales bacterium]
MPLLAALLATISASIAAGVVGCGDGGAGSSGAQGSDTGEQELLRELRRARDEVAGFSASARAQVKNTRSHRETLSKAKRIFEGLAVGKRIPNERDEGSIHDALSKAADKAEMDVHEVSIEAKPRDERDLPDRTVAPKEMDYRPDDLREVLEVTFRLTPADIGRLERFDRALMGAEPRRLVALRSAKATPQGFEVRAEAFRFVEVDPPEVVAQAPTEDEVLGTEQVQRLLPKLRDRPAVDEELEGLRADLEEAKELAEDATEALDPIGEANLVVARTEVLQRQVEELEDREVADILR